MNLPKRHNETQSQCRKQWRKLPGKEEQQSLVGSKEHSAVSEEGSLASQGKNY